MSASLYSGTKRTAERIIDFHVRMHGHAYVGVALAAIFDAAGEYLVRCHGSKKAFEAFTREADKAIASSLPSEPQTS